MRVKGVPGECGKDFQIEHEGETYLAVRSGNQFSIGNHVASLKELKRRIAAGLIREPDGSKTCAQVLESSTPFGFYSSSNAFACVHPCAWLVLEVVGKDCSTGVLDTLDCYGYLTPEGRPDVARARREIESFRSGS